MSGKLSHLKFPTNPDAVLAFLAGLGLSSADVAALVAKDPQFLCAGMDRTLTPILGGLTDLGLSHSEIGRLVSLGPASFRCSSIVSNLPYYLSLFGSYDDLFQVIKNNSSILRSSLEKVVKPNVTFLWECGLSACDIAKTFTAVTWLLNSKLERLQVMVACAEGLGVPRGSVMFRYALHAIRSLSNENVAAKMDYLKKTFRWSDADVGFVVSKVPSVLARCKDMLQYKSDFLISEVGLEPTVIAHQPQLLTFSLEGRLRPRYYAVKFLKETGLVKRHPSYTTVVSLTEKVFMEKFICPHEEAGPHLSEDYAAACRGEVPTNFRFI